MERWFTNLCDTKPSSSAHEGVSGAVCVINCVLSAAAIAATLTTTHNIQPKVSKAFIGFLQLFPAGFQFFLGKLKAGFLA